MSTIISADKIKEQLPNYDPELAESFHRESAGKADKLFEYEVKKGKYTRVVLLNGGSASGKSEFLATHLVRRRAVIFDGTSSTILGIKNKLRFIEKMNKVPVIYSVIPDDITLAYVAFLNRDRKFSDDHFLRTHVGARKTLLWLASNYSKLEIHIIESTYSTGMKLQFKEIMFESRNVLVTYVAGIQLEEGDIIKLLKS